MEDANFETTTANAAILRLTRELTWIDEMLAPGAGALRLVQPCLQPACGIPCGEQNKRARLGCSWLLQRAWPGLAAGALQPLMHAPQLHDGPHAWRPAPPMAGAPYFSCPHQHAFTHGAQQLTFPAALYYVRATCNALPEAWHQEHLSSPQWIKPACRLAVGGTWFYRCADGLARARLRGLPVAAPPYLSPAHLSACTLAWPAATALARAACLAPSPTHGRRSLLQLPTPARL
jgi:hypothetical protein